MDSLRMADDSQLKKSLGSATKHTLVPDNRFEGKIKWYVKPMVLGGDPMLGENVVWVSHEEHAQLATYWNELYGPVKGE